MGERARQGLGKAFGSSAQRASRASVFARRAWVGTLLRTRREAQRDHLPMVAAGVAFYAFLSVFPALAALVSVYGLVSDPNQVEQQIDALRGVMPEGVRGLLGEQLRRIAGGSDGALSWGFALSLMFAVWSATKGTKSLIEAMNIAYDEQEKRGFMKLNALALVLTIGGVLTMVLALIIVVGAPSVLGLIGLGGVARVAVDLLRWPLLIAILLAGLAVVYWLGPARDGAKWQWITPGSLLAAMLWLAVSIAFSIYVANFGSYEKTYGSLGAVVILLMWLYVGSYVILLGAELNAEIERREPSKRTSRPTAA